MTGRAEIIEALAAWWAEHDGNPDLKATYVPLMAELTDIQLGDLFKATEHELLQSPIRTIVRTKDSS